MLMQTPGLGAGSANILLSQLVRSDLRLIDHRLERVTLDRDTTLFNTDDEVETVYFPETVLVSLEKGCGTDDRIETGLIGSEGVVGWSALIGCGRSSHRAIVQMRAGTALRISTRDLLVACASSATLFSAVVRFADIIIVQMAHAICSHLRDTVERRVSRWLLMRHDRVTGDELVAKHDEIGANLGVRRASVTDCLHILEGDHLIRCYRGRIIIRDREQLIALAADSYGAAEDRYRAVIGPFGKTPISKEPSAPVADGRTHAPSGASLLLA